MNEDRFHVVENFWPPSESWRVVGVFSVEAEALAMRDRLNAAPGSLRAASATQMTYEELAQRIYDDRLGRLAQLLRGAWPPQPPLGGYQPRAVSEPVQPPPTHP